ncbi:hypothetical protein KAR91_34900 [Candidatus Pacearchaeota archaeon]|nr:hypothetical protein [Candidatus Pacearchaeota archaeon]
MDIYSINDIPHAKGYFPTGKDIILEMYDDAGALIPIDTTISFTGNTTTGSLIISNIADTSLLVIGQVVEGVGIPTGSKITDKSANTITLDQLATITDTDVSLKAFTLCTPGPVDLNIYSWSFANITTQPSESLAGYWRMRTSDDSYTEAREDFQWGGWPDNIAEDTRIAPFPTDQTQSTPRVKGDNIDFIFDFQEDVTGWKFMFTLVDPNDTFELKKGSANVSGGSSDQISVEPTETFSRVIAKVLKEETETFDGTDGNYELQFITAEDEQGTVPGVIVFKDELINKDWVIP